ncbi:M23 family metallopeptidase [Alkalibacillus aidingensis]|uniref:M23 family metallopeptidase n=1 Tax=Alkalibacillus aidingensis TaxID=2747607 RepID=UPI0016613275|nr:M23 family metallopeptidase [Alkalibacillus aidingensis]
MKLFSKWQVLVMSDANQQVKQITLPKFLLYCSVIIFLIMSISLVLFITITKDLTQEQAELETSLVEANQSLEEQENQIATYEQDRIEVENHLNELKTLEEQLIEMVSALEPKEIGTVSDDGPQGGIEIYHESSKHPKELDNLEEEVSIDLSNLKEEVPDLINRYKFVLDELEDVKRDLETVPVYWPADTERVTSEFGIRTDPFTNQTAYHNGIDLASEWGTDIYATGDGVVTFADRDGGYGLSVIINHPNAYETRFAHLGQLMVEEGDIVKQGDVIGLMGSTGRSTGVHLHYEIFHEDQEVDPYPYMTFLQRVLNE